MPTPTPRTTKNALSKAFDTTAVPVYLLDPSNVFIYVNPAFLQWTDRTLEQVVGQSCCYSSHGSSGTSGNDSDTPFNGLAPPPDLLAAAGDWPSFTSFTATVSVTLADGLQQRQCQFVALPKTTGDITSAFVLGIIEGDQPEGAAGDGLKEPSADSNALHGVLVRLEHELRRHFAVEGLVGVSDFSVRLRKQVLAAGGNDLEITIVGPAGTGRQHLANMIFEKRCWAEEAGTKSLAARPVVLQGLIADAQLVQSCVRQALENAAELAKEKRAYVDQSGMHRAQGRAGGWRPAAWLLVTDAERLNHDAQAELWSAMQQQKTNLRIIATSENDLIKASETGVFHEGLAWRINTLVVETIPLAQRSADIPLLAQYFLEDQNLDREQPVARFDDKAMQMLTEYHWPENIAELRTVVEQSASACGSAVVTTADLPEKFHHAVKAQRVGKQEEVKIDLDRYLEKIESELMGRAIRFAKGNKTKAAELLGLNRARLLRRIEHLGLEQEAIMAKTKSAGIEMVEDIEFKPLNGGGEDESGSPDFEESSS